VVLIAMRSLRMGPYRDPIRALVQCGTGDDVRRVIVDGRTVVEGGHVVRVDEGQVLAEAQREAERLWAEVREWHWEEQTADELSPPSLPGRAADLRVGRFPRVGEGRLAYSPFLLPGRSSNARSMNFQRPQARNTRYVRVPRTPWTSVCKPRSCASSARICS